MPVKWQLSIRESAVKTDRDAWVLEQDNVTIGRYDVADVVLGWDGGVSRLHVRLDLIDGRVRVSDLDSANGTSVLCAGSWRGVEHELLADIPLVLKVGDTDIEVHCESSGGLDSTSADLSTSFLLSEQQCIDDRGQVEAIMVLDLCDSSGMVDRYGNEMAFHLKKRLFQICDSVLLRRGSAHRKNTGDGFYAVFDAAEPALAAALGVLKRLELRNKMTERPPIEVRVALHYGTTFVMDDTGDRHGNDMNIAFRIEGVQAEAFEGGPQAALPGVNRLIVSAPFLQAAPLRNEDFSRLGLGRLKGIAQPVELYIYSGGPWWRREREV